MEDVKYEKRDKKDVRKEIADKFINNLKNDGLEWKKNWKASNSSFPENAITGYTYSGMNKFNLMMENHIKDYTDTRWATFKQIQSKGWKLKKDSKGCPIEFFMVYHKVKGNLIPLSEYNKLDIEKQKEYKLTTRISYVFNACCIDGIEPKKEPEKTNIVGSKLIEDLSREMNVPIKNDGVDRAFYSPTTDKISLPEKSAFKSEYDYNATALHELSHSTGHKSRLDRDLTGGFGSEKYAKEELVAEISSAFMSVNLDIEQQGSHIDNHSAYINNWIALLDKDPAILINAIKEADKVNNYMEECLGIKKEITKEVVKEETKEVIKPKKDLKERINKATEMSQELQDIDKINEKER